MALTELLPGIREIRTPIVAGYLWLCASWLAISPHVTQRDIPNEIRDLVDAQGIWREVVLGAAVTFVALVVGMIADGILDVCVRMTERRVVPSDPVEGFFGWGALHAKLAGRLSRLKTGPTKSGLRSLNLLAIDRVREAERQLQGSNRDIRDLVVTLGFVDDRELLRETGVTPIRQSLAAWLAIRIVNELELVARRLVTDRPQLFAQYNRLKVEAQFRIAVAAPLLALLIVLAVVWTPWFVVGSFAVPILIHQAIRKGDAAGDLLIAAILIEGGNTARALEQVSQAAEELSLRSPRPI